MLCGFPIKRLDSGFPGQGISCSWSGVGGRRSGKDTAALHSWHSWRQPVQLPGATAARGTGPVSRCPGMAEQHPTWGAPWTWSDGDPSCTSPTHPRLSEKRTNPSPGRRDLGSLGAVSQKGRGFCFQLYLVGLPSLSPIPREALENGQGTGVAGWGEGGEGQRALRFFGTWDSCFPFMRLSCSICKMGVLSPSFGQSQHCYTVVSPYSSNCLFAEPLLIKGRYPALLCTETALVQVMAVSTVYLGPTPSVAMVCRLLRLRGELETVQSQGGQSPEPPAWVCLGGPGREVTCPRYHSQPH